MERACFLNTYILASRIITLSSKVQISSGFVKESFSGKKPASEIYNTEIKYI
jgi:hypothetical protein